MKPWNAETLNEERKSNLDNPRTFSGFTHWAFLGIGGAVLALLVAYLFPSIIPAKSAGVKL